MIIKRKIMDVGRKVTYESDDSLTGLKEVRLDKTWPGGEKSTHIFRYDASQGEEIAQRIVARASDKSSDFDEVDATRVLNGMIVGTDEDVRNNTMTIELARGGSMVVDKTKLIHFKDGILNFPDQHKYTLFPIREGSRFYSLQSTERKDLAFSVCDPRLLDPDYRVELGLKDLESIDLRSISDSQILVIINEVNGKLNRNLTSPLIVNPKNREAMQYLNPNPDYSSHHPLMRLPGETRK